MVSIITITYNRANIISETISSVMSQTIGDFEYIIIDDNSIDNTREIVNSFNDSRIKYYKYVDVDKISKLRNIGLKKAEGEFIAFIDSDDVWDQNKLQLQLDCLRLSPEAGLSFHSVSTFSANGIIIKDLYNNSGIITLNMFDKFIGNKLVIYPSTLLFRKSCLSTVNLIDESFDEGEHDFIARLCFQYPACVINKPLCKIRKHGNNLNPENHLRSQPHLEYLRTLKNFYSRGKISRKVYRKITGFNYFMIGKILSANNNIAEAKENFFSGFIQNPFSITGLKSVLKYMQAVLVSLKN